MLSGENPSYLLSGRNFRRRVVYLSLDGAVPEAARAGLTYVVITAGQKQRPAVGRFRAHGWAIRQLGGYWVLAAAPDATDGACA